jgi:dihydrodipicolinate synthase/N-acetylneuraminate lyase
MLLNMTSVIMKFGPGGIKAAMDMLGFFGGEPMRPLKPPLPAACKDIQATLENFKNNLAKNST